MNVTPKKREVRITIDREIVVRLKEKKEKGKAAAKGEKPASGSSSPATESPVDAGTAADVKSELAAVPASERPADEKSVTTTTSPAHATKVLQDALDNIFAQGFDSRMMAAMPDFWKLYYEAAANETDYRPKDPAVLRENTVDKKAQIANHLRTAVKPVRAGPRRRGYVALPRCCRRRRQPTEIASPGPLVSDSMKAPSTLFAKLRFPGDKRRQAGARYA